MKKRLVVKLFFSYLLVLLVAGVVLAASVQVMLPAAFERHLGGAEGTGKGWMGGRHQTEEPPFYTQFKDGVNEALWRAGLTAVLMAGALSWAISRRIVEPVRQMEAISQRIAAGEFDQRVPVSGEDELGQLARSFNRMAEDLAQVERRRQRLIGDVSHELRTPLTAIQGYMEGLIDGVLPAEAETFAQIHEESVRLSRLVDDLQELSRIEAGAYTLHLEAVALSDALRAVQKRLRHQFESKDLHLEIPAVPADWRVRADSERLVQILINLLGNAWRYTPSGGSVRVQVARRDAMLEICIQDTGIGISADDLPHIFERFYRADDSRSRRRGGSGIGLTVVQHLVAAQGGRVWAESEGAGRGSRFCFQLPAA